MFFIFCFPNHYDFVYRDVTGFAVTVLQVQYPFFDFQDFTTKT